MSLPRLTTFPSANGSTGFILALPTTTRQVSPTLHQHPINGRPQQQQQQGVDGETASFTSSPFIELCSPTSVFPSISRYGRSHRPICALCTKRRAHIRRRQQAVWQARSVQPTLNIFPDQSWGSQGTALGNIPITGFVGSRNGHVVWRVRTLRGDV